MKTLRFAAVLALMLSAAPATRAADTVIDDSPVAVIAQAQPANDVPANPTKDVDVNVSIGTEPAVSSAWYASPVWIAIWILGGVVVLMLLVMAARGSGQAGAPTVVKG